MIKHLLLARDTAYLNINKNNIRTYIHQAGDLILLKNPTRQKHVLTKAEGQPNSVVCKIINTVPFSLLSFFQATGFLNLLSIEL